jgi:hypothetical protein
MYCSRCSQALYCSKYCRKASWKEHKKACRQSKPWRLGEAIFKYNEGFLVTLAECRKIAAALTIQNIEDAIRKMDDTDVKGGKIF